VPAADRRVEVKGLLYRPEFFCRDAAGRDNLCGNCAGIGTTTTHMAMTGIPQGRKHILRHSHGDVIKKCRKEDALSCTYNAATGKRIHQQLLSNPNSNDKQYTCFDIQESSAIHIHCQKVE